MVYTHADHQLPIVPRNGDPYAKQWAQMSRFEQLCWYWHHTNSHLADHVQCRARFEDVIADYDEFRHSMLDRIGISVSKEEWQETVTKPRNTSGQYRRRALLRRLLPGSQEPRFPPLAHWSRWNSELSDQFWAICGSTMERLGYSLNTQEHEKHPT
jgi:hypothetical protein